MHCKHIALDLAIAKVYTRIFLSRVSRADYITRIFYGGLQLPARVLKEVIKLAAASFESVGTGGAAARWRMDNDQTRTISAEFWAWAYWMSATSVEFDTKPLSSGS